MTDREIMMTALTMYRNVLDTGNASYSPQDIINCGLNPKIIKVLDEDQLRLKLRIQELWNKLLELK